MNFTRETEQITYKTICIPQVKGIILNGITKNWHLMHN